MHAIKLLLLLIIACMQETEPVSQELRRGDKYSHLHLASAKVNVTPGGTPVKANITAIELAEREDFEAKTLQAKKPLHDNSPLKFKLIKFNFIFEKVKYICKLETLEGTKLSHAIVFNKDGCDEHYTFDKCLDLLTHDSYEGMSEDIMADDKDGHVVRKSYYYKNRNCVLLGAVAVSFLSF